MSLKELAIKHGTDKAFFYADFYETLFAGMKVSKLLELGIGSPETMKESVSRAGWTDYKPGASLRMWAEYFPEAQIYAMDRNRNILINEGRIHSQWFEQSDVLTYRCFNNQFDIIIDDGSHELMDQLTARSYFVPLSLANGGIYITEDLADPDHWPGHVERFENEYGKAAIGWIRSPG